MLKGGKRVYQILFLTSLASFAIFFAIWSSYAGGKRCDVSKTSRVTEDTMEGIHHPGWKRVLDLPAKDKLAILKHRNMARLRNAMNWDSFSVVEKDYSYYGVKTNGLGITRNGEEARCDMRRDIPRVRSVRPDDLPVNSPLRSALPKNDMFQEWKEGNRYPSCAVVSNSAAILKTNLGRFIDDKDVVVRLNDAPTKGFENQVGNRTDLRIVNSQLFAKDYEKAEVLLSNPGTKVIVWDPSKYGATLEEWLKSPQENFFGNYIKHRKSHPDVDVHILHPAEVWKMWDFLQSQTVVKVKPNPTSTGFIAMLTMLPVCSKVHMVEYIPSARETTTCRYYMIEKNKYCTYGVWHPLAAEKLLTYRMKEDTSFADDNVFYGGFATIPGYSQPLNCTERV